MNDSNSSLNEKLIISATNYARIILNIDESLWVFINDGNHFKSINHSGLFDKENFIIRFNRERLNTAETASIVKCAFHEVFHSAQLQALIEYDHGVKSNLFTVKELEQLSNEFRDENYSDASGRWETMLCEQQAEAFANHLYERYKDGLENIQDFVQKYHKRFVNKEQHK